jgi:uncharacterized repeat protein (TIGR03837 family)
MRWDIFCRVVDNLGDIGVCWRLAAELAARGEAVRLWVDAPDPLTWMVPGGRAGAARLGVALRDWDPSSLVEDEPAEVVVEAFGCDPHPGFLAAMAQTARVRGAPPAWFNLEYLSAEAWVARCHGLASPVLAGPAAGLGKRFFYPGFTPETGGLIRETGLDDRQARFDRGTWMAGLGLPPPARGERLVSLFCYEPPTLPALLGQLAAQGARLLVTPGRAQVALEAALVTLGSAPKPAWNLLPPLPQTGFDELLWACDLNFVRGEDSLVRALWAGRPFVWQTYPQHDGVHLDKLAAFLDWLQAPASLRQAHAAWNQAQARAGTDPTFPRQGALPWPALDLPAWAQTARAARERLGAGSELVAQLMAAAGAWVGRAPKTPAGSPDETS